MFLIRSILFLVHFSILGNIGYKSVLSKSQMVHTKSYIPQGVLSLCHGMYVSAKLLTVVR